MQGKESNEEEEKETKEKEEKDEGTEVEGSWFMATSSSSLIIEKVRTLLISFKIPSDSYNFLL